MNVAEKLAALEALLDRVRRNAAARRGIDGSPPLVAGDEPVLVERATPKRHEPIAPPAPHLDRLLAQTWDRWGDGPETRPENLTELLGQPVPRAPRTAQLETPAPAPAPAAPTPPEPVATAAPSARPAALDGPVLRAVTERPLPAEPTVPPQSFGRAAGSRRRGRSRRWFTPRSATRRSRAVNLGQLGLGLLIVLPVFGGAVYALRRPPPVPPPRVMSEAGTALARALPSAAPSASTPPEPRPLPSAEPASANLSTLESDRGYVVVTTADPARVYFNGVLVGDANRTLEVACGWRNMRLAKPAMPGPGQSFPIWLGEGRPVLIACQGTTTLDMTGK